MTLIFSGLTAILVRLLFAKDALKMLIMYVYEEIKDCVERA